MEETTTQARDAAVPPKTTKVLDAEGRVTEVHDAAGGTVRYAYGPFARLAVVTGAELTSTVIDYDPYQRQEDASKTSEFFHYDALDRLTCSTFAACRPGDVSWYGGAPAPGSCDQSVTYDPSGNITSKSDVGGYTYDPEHPHAVKTITGVGAATYGYDAVGNQTERPGVIGTITYNSFDLPTKYTTAMGATSLTYDDAGARIRKVDPAQETLYFGEIYERITTAKGVEDRYYLSNAEGVFAVARRGGS